MGLTHFPGAILAPIGVPGAGSLLIFPPAWSRSALSGPQGLLSGMEEGLGAIPSGMPLGSHHPQPTPAPLRRALGAVSRPPGALGGH